MATINNVSSNVANSKTAASCLNMQLKGIIRGTNFTITGLGDGETGLVQQFSLEFQRRLSRVYDLASPSFYYIEGPSEGKVSFSKVVGPAGAPKLSCDCSPRTIVLNAGNALCDNRGADAKYTLKNALPFGLSGQGNATDFLLVFSISYMFSDIV